MSDIGNQDDLDVWAELGGLIGVSPRMPVQDNYALSIIYTPGVAEPCKEIADDEAASYTYTWRSNALAVVGPDEASLPRLEAAAAALKLLAGIDAVPLVVAASGPGETASAVRLIAPTFGGAWLLGIEGTDAERVIEELTGLDIPVIPAPRDGDDCLADVAAYPGLIRAILDLKVAVLDERLVEEAAAEAGRAEFSFGSAVRVARAVAEKAVELGLAANDAPTPDAVEARLAEYVEGGRLRPFRPVEDWLAAPSPKEAALRLHASLMGTLAMHPKVAPRDPARFASILSSAGQAEAAIRACPEEAERLTAKANTVAVVTDGSAVLGLGDIGAAAALPVMLGKSVLFKTFGGCDAVPICIDTRDPAEIIGVVEAIAPSFAGVNLEDISAPRCFEIEDALKERLDCFVFHDDQHGTAVITLAGLLNAARLCGKTLDELTVTFNGAGAAGIAVSKLLLAAGVQDVILCDREGAIYKGRSKNMNPMKEHIAEFTNRDGVQGALADAIRGRNVFIGLSVAGAMTADMIQTMAEQPVIFAMANPVPEVMPDEARAAGAVAVATGRSDFPNQINNCLGFPGIFRGALDVRAKSINDEMKMAAARAIAGLVADDELRPEYFIPSAMDLRVPPAVAGAIAQAALATGEARIKVNPGEVATCTKRFLYEGRLQGS